MTGFVNPHTCTQRDGVELLTPSGSLAVVPYSDLKALCFVKDSASADPWKPNLFFSSRPKTEGLWTRFVFRDGDRIDGLLPGNLLALDAEGFTVTPPDAGLSVTRMFLPRQALTGVEVLGVDRRGCEKRPRAETRSGGSSSKCSISPAPRPNLPR